MKAPTPHRREAFRGLQAKFPTQLGGRQAQVRKNGKLPWLRPDAKSDQPTLPHPLKNVGQITLKPFELGPGTAFAAHFGVSSPAVVWPCEIQGPLLLEADALECPLRIEQGRLWPPDGPGLGIKLALDRLRSEDKGGLCEPTGAGYFHA